MQRAKDDAPSPALDTRNHTKRRTRAKYSRPRGPKRTTPHTDEDDLETLRARFLDVR